MKKKVLIIVSLIVVLGIGLFVLTGCGNKEKSITSEKTESKTTSTETKNDNDLVGTWEGETTGGLKTTFVFENGGTVKYGRIYRSANPNKGNDSTSPSLKEVGINLIVDLRGKTSDSKPVNYSGLEHKYISVGSYSPNANNIRKAVREIMANVVNGKNVLFHCAIGTDRTGTVAFLLEGILGVSKSNLYVV